MDHAERIAEQLTPEQRRERLRAFADRMLIALGGVDDPETGGRPDGFDDRASLCPLRCVGSRCP